MVSACARLKTIRIIITVFLLLLLLRIGFLQLVKGTELAEVSDEQHEFSLNIIENRGTIYDRNFEKLTDKKECSVYYINKNKIEELGTALLKSANAVRIGSSGSKYEIYRSEKLDDEAKEEIKKVYDPLIIDAYQRYDDKQTAAHLIGYVNRADNKGVVGLEKKYQDILGIKSMNLSVIVDGATNILTTKGAQLEKNEMSGIITTLDSNIQTYAEKLLYDSEVNGAIVISEIKTGEIIACASSPTFNPNKVEKYISSNSRELFNRAVQGTYQPGSVFKIVVAVAALESGIATPETLFSCNGYEDLYGVKIKCSSGGKEGHGSICLKDAFAKSCNCTFIQLGKMVGAEKILEMSLKLGLGSEVCDEIDEENTGHLPDAKEIRGAAIGNLSIGQGDLLVTPLQINRMTQIVSNGGIRNRVSLVKCILDKDNAQTASAGLDSECQAQTASAGLDSECQAQAEAAGEDFADITQNHMISQKTAEEITEMMIQTVETGTASSLKKYTSLSAGGKTGSAEGISNDGERTVHAWFTGFIPADSKKYAITVFVEDGKSGSSACVPIFGKMADYLETNKYI